MDSRPIDSAGVVRRRRMCKSCHKRFTTYERLEEMPLMVVKSDHRREPYDRNKLREGILRACEKRPISIDTIDLIVDEVEYELKDYVMEISSRIIGEKVLGTLHAIDQVAYIRFASVYRNFSDIDSFLAEIRNIKSKRNGKKSRNSKNRNLEKPDTRSSIKTIASRVGVNEDEEKINRNHSVKNRLALSEKK